jgi:hypothetical protein
MLIAIDGTESRRARHSSVREFCARYVGAKLYCHGPDHWVTGSDLWHGVDAALSFIMWNRKSLGPGDPIDLVGHSRGGMGVIVLAQRLKAVAGDSLPVRFMGLYDAVDRTPTLVFGTIPANVLHVRHAMRSPAAGSRPYFGNTGTMSARAVDYVQRTFHGTHAAIGGDPWQGDHPRQVNEAIDRIAARAAQLWICGEARGLGVPVT